MAGSISTKLVKTMYASDWSANDPLLDEGEVGTEIDTGVIAVGDGTTRYTDLPKTYPMLVMTQAEYDALGTPDENILYFITD